MARGQFRIVFNKFPALTFSMRGAVQKAVVETAADIERMTKEQIQANDQVDTGFMLNSVATEPIGPGAMRVFVGASYGIFQENGTRFMPGRPFFRPSVERGRSMFRQRIKAALR